MKQFLRRYDVGLRLLSLILAFILWAFSMAEVNPERSPRYDGLKVTLTGEDELLMAHGLTVIEMDTTQIAVTVRGPNDEVTNKNMRQRIMVSANVSGLTDAGEYNLPPVVNISRDGIEVVSTEPKTIRVQVDEVTAIRVPIRVDVSGSPKEGFRAGKAYATMSETVKIEGPKSELNEVAYAYAVINADGLESTKKEDCAITLCNDAGEAVTGPHIICKTEKINVSLPIYKINTIPLTVTLRDGGTAKADQATVTYEPAASINVIGDQKTIAEMGELSLGEFDLDSVRTDVPIELPVILPEGVRLDEGQPETIQVMISIDGVATRKLHITRFSPNDTAAEQTPYQVSVLTSEVELELRGSEEALAGVDVNSFSIGLTFDSVSLGAGEHEVKGVVAATGLPEGVTLVEEDVQVLIQIVAPDGS